MVFPGPNESGKKVEKCIKVECESRFRLEPGKSLAGAALTSSRHIQSQCCDTMCALVPESQRFSSARRENPFPSVRVG